MTSLKGERCRKRWRLAAVLAVAAVLIGAGVPLLSRLLVTQVLGAELPTAAPADADQADPASLPGATPEYRDAVGLFLQARRSDNPQHDYSACIAAFQQLAKTSDAPELRLRSHYFLAFAFLLQGDVGHAYEQAKQVLALARVVCRDDARVELANRLAARAEKGEANLADVRMVLAAQAGVECSRLAGDLSRYAQPHIP